MMVSAFTLYLLAVIAIMSKKKKLAWLFTWAGLLLSAYIVWYHATSTLGINLQ
jgi:hypothetical protein